MGFDLKNRKLKIALLISVVILCVIVFRIYTNLKTNEIRAQRVLQGSEMTVDAMIVQRSRIEPTLIFSANLEPVWSADISPKIDSRLDSLYVDEGDYVKAGQIIAQMDVLELSAQVYQQEGLLYEARSDSENAELDYERSEKLYAQSAISKRDLDNAKYQRDMSLGRYLAAQGGFNALKEKLDAATIRVPRDGVVTRRHLYAGHYISSGTPIVSIGDVTTLLAKADISEGQISDIYLGAEVEVRVIAYPERVFTGTVSRVSPMAELPARTFKTEITIPNYNEELKAGMFATVAVKGKIRENTLVVPQSAVVMREDQKTVYIINGENVIQQVLLEIGATQEGKVEVLRGLAEGDMIVVSGQNRLRQGVKVIPSLVAEADGQV